VAKITDIVTPDFVKLVRIWGAKTCTAVQAHRCSGRDIRLRSWYGAHHAFVQPWAAFCEWDLTTLQPLRRIHPPKHSITLGNLRPYLTGFDDTTIVDICELLGFSTGACPPWTTILHPNHRAFYEADFHQALAFVREEVKLGYVKQSTFLPFFPCRIFPMYLTFSNKWRLVNDYAYPRDGTEVNACIPLWQSAVLRLINHDALVRTIARLLARARVLRKRGIAVQLAMGVADIVAAYRNCAVDAAEGWLHGMHWVEEDGTLVFGRDTRAGFGGRKSPLDFSRVTRAIVHAAHLFILEKNDNPASHRWALELAGDARLAAEIAEAEINTLPLQLAGHRLSRADRLKARTHAAHEAAADDRTWPWAGIAPDQDLTHALPLRELTPAQSPLAAADLHHLAGYLDDNLVVAVELAETPGAAERLRGHLQTVMHMAGFETVTRQGQPYEKGLRKWQQGACNTVQTFTGLQYDLDLDQPSITLPLDKLAALKELVAGYVSPTVAITAKQCASLAGKLASAARVVPRGRLYCQGPFQLAHCGHAGPVPRTRWFNQCLQFWHDFLNRDDVPPRQLLVPPPSTERTPHSDASGTGYGGWWEHGTTIYAFHGVWDADVQAAFNARPDVHINTLELLAVDWMLQLAGPHFCNETFVVKCDNMPSVDQLCSFAARKGVTASLLTSVDRSIAAHQLDPQFEHIEGVLNRLADMLSRQARAEFENRVRALFPSHSIQFLQVHHLRNFGIVRQLL
jgi:hypothetical protein